VLVRFDAVISSYLGETAANMRRVFDFAASRPMVLLFDEFDAVGKKRDDAEEHGELKRVVNAFLQMLDSSRGDALTIAATNQENA
jgi:SpoVK/Ycf46/Vps4 family AAA+-type ATPase